MWIHSTPFVERTECSDRRSLVYSKSHPNHSVYSCAIQRKLLYNGSLLSLALCRIMWSTNMPLLHLSHSTPPLKPLTSLHPNHYRFSQLAALQRDGPGWCTPKEFTTSQIRNQQMQDSVRKYFHLSSLQYYFLVEHYSNICLLSIDCYYLYFFRLINHTTE